MIITAPAYTIRLNRLKWISIINIIVIITLKLMLLFPKNWITSHFFPVNLHQIQQ